MDLGLKDKVALVAASSKGLGFGIAKALAQEGAHVSMASREQAHILAAADTLQTQTQAQILASVMDATDKASIDNWVDTSIAQLGGIDTLVVNAGGPPAGHFDDFDDDHWQSAFELTLMSCVRMIRAVLPAMRKRGGGSILAITSSSVKEPIDILLLSNVMRSGVTSLIKSLSISLAKENIRLNCLMPGRIDTERVRSLDEINAKQKGIAVAEQKASTAATIPMGRYGNIDEFGKAGAFLLSDAASYVTGETFIVDGGLVRTVW